ncbi:MAG TPA: sensor histidine kinase [Kofleriaceae bacterium]|nr:sensor histidine kinase [Kofleriaceae bacterium]
MSDHDRSFARPVVVAAIAVMIVATVGGPVLFARGMDLRPIFALAVPFLAVSTVGWWWCERRGRAALRVMLVAQVVLAVALVWVSDQNLFLLVLPPLLVVVLYEGVWWGTATVVAVVGIAALQNAQAGVGLEQIYLRSTGFVPGAIVAIAFAHVMVRERRAQEELAELAAVRERNRIARDIHDSVGHYLTVVNVQIQAARAVVSRDPQVADECLGRASTLAREGLGELRRSVSMLRASRAFDVSLARLIDDAKQGGLDASLAIGGTPRALAPELEVALYRAMQEALTNVARHAKATRVRASLSYAVGEVRLHVKDDGRGASETDGGYGLAGMKERITALGGDLEITSAPGQGFTLDVRVPA